MAFYAVYPLLDALPGGAVAKEKGKFFPPSGKNCGIDSHGKWKMFSSRPGRLVPDTGSS
jgi:hypothetical protein